MIYIIKALEINKLSKSTFSISIVLLIMGIYTSVQCQDSRLIADSEKIQQFIKQNNNIEDLDQIQSNLDSLSNYLDIHDFALNHLFDICVTPIHHQYHMPYFDYVCNNMDAKYSDSLKVMIENFDMLPLDMSRIYDCMFETEKESCDFINSFEYHELDSTKTRYFKNYIKVFDSKRSLCLDNFQSTNLDSFEIQKRIVEIHGELEYLEFDSLLIELSKYGDIHNFVLERMGESRRTSGMHEYYPAFSSFICNHMDSIYRNEIIELIEADSIQRSHAYPFVKSCLFDSKEKTCEFLNSLDLEEKYDHTESLLYESLIKLKKEMSCSM